MKTIEIQVTKRAKAIIDLEVTNIEENTFSQMSVNRLNELADRVVFDMKDEPVGSRLEYEYVVGALRLNVELEKLSDSVECLVVSVSKVKA